MIKIYSPLLRNRFISKRLLYSFFFFQIFINRMGEKNCNPCEQFVLLAKTAKVRISPPFPVRFHCHFNLQGAAAVELIKQALEAPGVYVFGELLDMANIQVTS